LTDEVVSVGRDAANTIMLNDLSASRRHCLIERDGEGYRVLDLDSHNGTFVNELPVKVRALEPGDWIKIGNSNFLYLDGERELSQPAHEVQLSDEALVTVTSVRLRVEDAFSLLVRELNALIKVGIAINSTPGFEALKRELLERIFDVVPGERGAILLLREGTEDFTSVFGLWRDPRSNGPVIVSRTVAQEVVREGVAILSNNVREEGRFESVESIITSRIHAFICVPVVLFGVTIGVIYLDTRDHSVNFEEGHLQMATAVANIAAGALENARRTQWLELENERLRAALEIEHNIVGESPRMRQVYEFIARVAPSDSTVMIRGESGTGKELVAHAIHRNSARAAKPLIVVNCATLAENLLESELFGHEKGAFTGAITQKRGKFELADGGTLFLDEVGELPIGLQAKLLRAIQQREFERVGGTRTIKVDIRIIAATNRDLEKAIKQGIFRQDLYYRLNIVSVVMPALRERWEDITLLASYFVSKYSEKCNRSVAGISAEARACLIKYDWPGNVRELENAIERALVLGFANHILPEDLPETVLEAGTPAQDTPSMEFYEQVREAKKQFILNAFALTNGDHAEAAKLLGVHPNNLHRLIRSLNLRAVLKK
jgi:Nif-specific regulatory protein